ncbi:hypothetical protein N331_12268, partial [Merops nubicus]
WPLQSDKLKAALNLTERELQLGHLEESISPWNTPIFVILKKATGQWRLLHDLRAVNAQLVTMGPLQPGLPKPTMIPKDWAITVLDIKDCFFSIPLHPQDKKRFVFSVPSVNLREPAQRFQWMVLPQGIKNSPVICQTVVERAILPVRRKYRGLTIILYMDDILVASPLDEQLTPVLEDLTLALKAANLGLAEAKTQRAPSVKYLGTLISPATVKPQLLSLTSQATTLHDAQKLVGALQWLRNFDSIPEEWMIPFYALL